MIVNKLFWIISLQVNKEIVWYLHFVSMFICIQAVKSLLEIKIKNESHLYVLLCIYDDECNWAKLVKDKKMTESSRCESDKRIKHVVVNLISG